MNERRPWVMILSLLVTGYFAFHAVYGSRGLLAWRELSQHHRQLLEASASKKAEVEALDHRVKLLRPAKIDPDLLDERARAMLGYVGKDEVVVIDQPKANLNKGRTAP
jgi:cell division protein FtsB